MSVLGVLYLAEDDVAQAESKAEPRPGQEGLQASLVELRRVCHEVYAPV